MPRIADQPPQEGPVTLLRRQAELPEESHEHVAPGSPRPSGPEQTQQIPHLQRMDLHRRRREQVDATGSGDEAGHVAAAGQQRKQTIGLDTASLTSAFRCAPTARVVGLVDDQKVPRLRRQKTAPSLDGSGALRRRQDQRPTIPRIARRARRAAGRHRRLDEVVEASTGKDRHVEGRFFPQLFLPLAQNRFGHQDQRPPDAARNPQTTQQQRGFDGLAEPHLVRQQIALWKLARRVADHPQLMGPRLHRARRHRQIARRRQERRSTDEMEEAALQLVLQARRVVDGGRVGRRVAAQRAPRRRVGRQMNTARASERKGLIAMRLR